MWTPNACRRWRCHRPPGPKAQHPDVVPGPPGSCPHALRSKSPPQLPCRWWLCVLLPSLLALLTKRAASCPVAGAGHVPSTRLCQAGPLAALPAAPTACERAPGGGSFWTPACLLPRVLDCRENSRPQLFPTNCEGFVSVQLQSPLPFCNQPVGHFSPQILQSSRVPGWLNR